MTEMSSPVVPHVIGTTTLPICSGYLRQRGRVSNSWTRRFFVLNNGFLSCFGSEKCSYDEKNRIGHAWGLRGVTVTNPSRCLMVLKAVGGKINKPFKIDAVDVVELQKWMAAFAIHITFLCDNDLTVGKGFDSNFDNFPSSTQEIVSTTNFEMSLTPQHHDSIDDDELENVNSMPTTESNSLVIKSDYEITPICSGYLRQQAKTNNAWIKRFFVLSNGFLSCFGSERYSCHEKNRIGEARSLNEFTASNPSKCLIVISTLARQTFTLDAVTPDELKKWMKVFHTHSLIPMSFYSKLLFLFSFFYSFQKRFR